MGRVQLAVGMPGHLASSYSGMKYQGGALYQLLPSLVMAHSSTEPTSVPVCSSDGETGAAWKPELTQQLVEGLQSAAFL